MQPFPLPPASGQAAGRESVGHAKPRLILGIDPGSRVTGFALLRTRREVPVVPADFALVEAGVLRADASLPHGERLGLLHHALFDLLSEQQPDVCVIEQAFFDKNASSALKLGELRGAYLAACARCAVPVAQLTPAEVKKAITGNGRADKESVSRALEVLLRFRRGALPHDATDALALSLCHGLRSGPLGLLVKPTDGTSKSFSRSPLKKGAI